MKQPLEPKPSPAKRQVRRRRRVAKSNRRNVPPPSSGSSQDPTAEPSTSKSAQHGPNSQERDCSPGQTQDTVPPPAAVPIGKNKRKRDYSDVGKDVKPLRQPLSSTKEGSKAPGVGECERPSKLSGHSNVSKCPRAGDTDDPLEGPSSSVMGLRTVTKGQLQKDTQAPEPRPQPARLPTSCQVKGASKAEASKICTSRATQKRKMDSSVQEGSSENLSVVNPSGAKKSRAVPQTGKGSRRTTTTTDPIQHQGTVGSLYTIGELLGKGGCGSVYAGIRKSDGAQVAIKIIPRGRKGDDYIIMPRSGELLPLEVGLMTMVSELPECSNIVKLLEWFKGSDVFVLILERPMPCMDLFDYCQTVQGGRLSEQQARGIMLQVVHAAKHCRDRGVLHRDIKRENLLVNTEDMSVKLIDFGCGDLLSRSPFKFFEGTEEFSPPEWVKHGKYEGGPATVWSLGVLLHLLLSGSLPFESEEEVVSGPLRFRRELSWECRDLIQWCLRKNPTERPVLEDILRHLWFKDTN